MREEIVTELDMVQDNQFRISFDDQVLADLMSDEPRPVGMGEHPNATRLPSAAVGNCLCSSPAFRLRKTCSEPISIRAMV